MTNDDKVLFEKQGNVALISINRPDQRNAIDAEACSQLRTAVDLLEKDDTLQVGVIQGLGKVFCAGMDLKAFTTGEAEEILFGPGRLGGFVSRTRRKPVVAAVQGAALAGGFELMLACDLVIATDTTIFGLPESKRGLVAGAGGAFRVGQLLPKAIANEILLTGDPITAQRALELGLVNKLVEEPDLLSSAIALAKGIAKNAPLSIRYSLKLAGYHSSLNEDAFWNLNDQFLRKVIESEDATEGAKAFAEKRAPVWTGQ